MPIREFRSFAELPSPSVVALTYVLHTHDLSNVALRNVIISTCPLHLGDAWRHDSGTAALRHCGTAALPRVPRWASAEARGRLAEMPLFPIRWVSCTNFLHKLSQSFYTVRVNHGFWCIFKRQTDTSVGLWLAPRDKTQRGSVSHGILLRLQGSSGSSMIFILLSERDAPKISKNGILTSKGLRFFSKLFHLFSSDIPMTFLTFLTAEARTRTLEVTDGYGWLRRLQLEEVPLWLCKATAKALWQPVLEAIVHWIYCLCLLFAPLLQYLLQR